MNPELEKALSLLFAAESVVELRAIGDSHIHSGYFDNAALLQERAETLDTLTDLQGIYVTLNAVNPALLSRRANRVKMQLTRRDATTADADILRRRWLPIDIDPVRPSGVSSTDAEHARALEKADTVAAWLAGLGFPDPIRADSGNGAHLLYRIDLENTDGSRDLVKRCLEVIAAFHSDGTAGIDTAVYNAARIWKLYGTISRKGDNTPERPHRRSRLLAVPDTITIANREFLDRLANALPCAPVEEKGYKKIVNLSDWLRKQGIAIKSEKPYQGGTLFTLAECPFSSAHKDGAFAIQFPNGAIYAGCHHTSCGGGSQRWAELRDRCMLQRKKVSKEEPPPPPPPVAESTCRDRALSILRQGDPFAFLLETFHREHVGDRIVAECLVLSIASQSVENTRGLHVFISGNSGKGKSNACTTMLRQVPKEFKLTGSVSNKALYYNEKIRPGTVLLFDDVSLSEDMQAILKSATSNFRERIEHQTLTADRQLRICSIPERCIWWLAKVEDAGDDQVMNRMLTVWIDDSIDQDGRVLDHTKKAEAQVESLPEEDEDLLVCQEIWRILKEDVLTVSIPYAERIQFSNSSNRRNPIILFDLIKAFALLHRLQRELFARKNGGGGIRADKDDFAAAARIYAAINGDSGGQETKLTRNEAAALKTIAGMGVETFTVKMLQAAMGLSYQKVRRLLHGYVSRGTLYTGLLEKCPAISYYDTTISDDACGIIVRRREHHFTFDPELYRNWVKGSAVWIDDDPDNDHSDDDNISAEVQHIFSSRCPSETSQEAQDSSSTTKIEEKLLSKDSTFQQNESTQHVESAQPPASPRVCDFRNAVTESEKSSIHSQNDKQAFQHTPMDDNRCCNTAVNHCHVLIQTHDYIPLPTARDEPCHVCGKKPTSSVKRGTGQYLCYDCLKGAKPPGKAQPLPGILHHGDFVRATAELGRCDICNQEKAVYRSNEQQTSICQSCYAALVRGWNERAGVR